jgi:hypothetical protein
VTISRFVIALTAWLGIGLIAHYAGVVSEGTLNWYLLLGIPGAIYALILFAGPAFVVIVLYILFSRHSEL